MNDNSTNIKQMNLTQSQIDFLTAIKKGIEKGDIKAIASTTGFTREYVGKVLSPTVSNYNEKIITEAVKIIEQRGKKRKRVLDALPI